MPKDSQYYINCKELEVLVKTYHKKTTVSDLEQDDIDNVFFPPVDREKLGRPGAVFEALDPSRVFPYGKYRRWKIRRVYNEFCTNEENDI